MDVIITMCSCENVRVSAAQKQIVLEIYIEYLVDMHVGERVLIYIYTANSIEVVLPKGCPSEKL